jgi:hypothetical protein
MTVSLNTYVVRVKKANTKRENGLRRSCCRGGTASPVHGVAPSQAVTPRYSADSSLPSDPSPLAEGLCSLSRNQSPPSEIAWSTG